MAENNSIQIPDLFPPLTRATILACQCSSWYHTLSSCTIKSIIIRPLPTTFQEYLVSDGVTVPLGSEDILAESTLSDDEDDGNASDGASDEPSVKIYSFPELDIEIRNGIKSQGGAVFPKLNWTSPKDSAWVLNPSSPLKCTSPSDVYLYLKTSDFAAHDLDPEIVFDGCVDPPDSMSPSYELELVLKKWYAIDRSREMRCFVRNETFLAISQRDTNYYDFLNNPETQRTILNGLIKFWETKLKGKFAGGSDYIFDVLLTRSLESAHLVDINPFAPRTDSLLFTYRELLDIYKARTQTGTTSPSTPEVLPTLRVIPSVTHPSAARNAPANQHNMIPMEALELSQGRGIRDFQETWIDQIRQAMEDDKKP